MGINLIEKCIPTLSPSRILATIPPLSAMKTALSSSGSLTTARILVGRLIGFPALLDDLTLFRSVSVNDVLCSSQACNSFQGEICERHTRFESSTHVVSKGPLSQGFRRICKSSLLYNHGHFRRLADRKKCELIEKIGKSI